MIFTKLEDPADRAKGEKVNLKLVALQRKKIAYNIMRGVAARLG